MLRLICAFFLSNAHQLKLLRRETKTMSDKIDALTAALADLGAAVHDALDKIQAELSAIDTAAADEAAVTDATTSIKAQVDLIRAAVPAPAPTPAPST